MEHRLAADVRPETSGGQPTTARGPKSREEIKASDWYQDLQNPKLRPGDPALDFSLPVLDTNHGLTSRVVRLSEFAGQRPVALIFGSYT